MVKSKSFESQSAFENELNDYFMLNGEFSKEKDETYPERINYYGKINKEIEEYLGYYEPDNNTGFMLEPVIGTAAKGAWFKEAVEEKAPYDLGGWSKSKPATVRRREALKSRDNKLTKHQQYISAARALQALANVTKDIDTKEVAKRDADYFFDEAKKFSDGDVIEHGDEHDEMAAKGKALKATAIDTKLSQNFYNSGVIFKVGDSYWAGHRKFGTESEAKSYIDSGQYTADFKNRSNIKGYEDAFIKRDFEIDNITLEGLKEIIYNKFSNCNIEERQRDTYYDYKNGFTHHTTEFTIKNCWEYLDKNTAKIMQKNNFNPMPIEINYQISRSISKPQYIAPGGNMYVYGTNKSHNRRPIYMSESSTKELQNAVDAFIKSSQERGYSTAEMIDDQLWWWKSEKYEQKHKSTSDYGIGSQAVSYVSYETSEVYRIKDLDKAFDKYIKLNYPNEEPHKVVENLIKNNFRFKKDKNIFDWDKGLLYNAGSYTETLDEDGGTVAKDGIKTKKRHIYAITLSQFDNPQYIEVDSKDIDDAVTKFKENGINVAPSMIYFSNKPPYYYKNGGGIAKENQEMVMNEAYQIQHHAHELLGVLKKNVEVPAWVVAKIHSSAENLSAATHYLAGTKGMSKYKNGGGLKQEWIAVFRNMQRPNEQRVISVLGSTKEDAMRDAEMSRHSNNITKEYQLINIYLSPSLKIVDYYETKELGVWMLETSDGVKEEYYYGDETSEEESGELVGYLYFYNKDNTRKALAKANFIGGSYDDPEWGDLEFIEIEIIAAKGKSIDDDSNSLADYERWRNSPDFSNSITILNEQDIDYSNWSDIDIYRWWVKKNENNDDDNEDDDDDDYAANGKYIKGLNKRIDRSIKSGRAMTLFRKMEDENYHSEAAFLVAKAVGTPQDIQDMADIVERHYDSDEGISTEDYNKRYEIQERLWPAFIAKYKKAKYSNGGGIKPVEFQNEGSTFYIHGRKYDVKKMYLDYVNNFLTIGAFADYYGMSDKQASMIIEQGKKYAEQSGQYSNGGGVSKPLNYHAHAIEQNGKIYIGKSYYEIINKQSPYFFNVDERTRGYVDKDTNFHPLDLETGYEAYANGGGVGESKKSSESKEFYDFKNDLEYALMSRYNVFLSDAGITNEYVKMAMNKGQNVDEIVDDVAREYDLVAINPAEKAMN